MKIVALDWGEKRIGVAVCETTLGVPFVRPQLEDLGQVLEMLEVEKAEKVLVGMPYQKDGSRDQTARLAESFAKELQEKINIPVEMIDERFTTKIAKSKMKEAEFKKTKDIKDSLSAIEIINTYLRKCEK